MLKTNTQRGIVILMAVLLVSIVLMISLTLMNITYKQLVLSSLARDSQIAFFASDMARNCVKYWDAGPSAPFGKYTKTVDSATGNITWSVQPPLSEAQIEGSVTCAGRPVDVTSISGSDVSFTVPISTSFGENLCASVSIQKTTADIQNERKTTIEASGYNRYNGTNCPTITSRTVERKVRTVYDD